MAKWVHCRPQLSECRPGNVYEAKGGSAGHRSRTMYWLIVSVRRGGKSDGAAYALGLDAEWNVVSAVGRNLWCFEERLVLFRFKGMDGLSSLLKAARSFVK